MKIIGIIGYGYVGQAVAYAHSKDKLIIRDPKLPNSADLNDFLDCDSIYVCVPSPSTEDGHCDASILEQTLKDLLFNNIKKPIPIICKTTATPSIYKRLLELYPNIVHVPEFLTAANHTVDYVKTRYFVLGGNQDWRCSAKDIIQSSVKLTDRAFIEVSIETAAFYKYMMNSYLATKVTFMNEFKQLADKTGVHWESIRTLVERDNRIGSTHMQVPGPDGKHGWGGACFPKDIAAIINEAIDLDLDFELMQRVETLNNKHRQ